MKVKYIGKSPLMIYDRGKPIQVSPGEELELKEVPTGFEKKFIEIRKVTEKKTKKFMEDK